ncbi:MAG: hypothetical protein ACJ76F_11930 [Bacteroidia bacterium]
MHKLFNLIDYTIADHVFFATGCLLWVFTYVIVIRNIVKMKFVEIPIVAVCANFAWEFLWSFVFRTDMGELYIWGYRIWFFLDCFIVFGLFRYGVKQVSLPLIAKYYSLITAACIAAWGVMLYYYIKIYDEPFTHMGANSGYILNVMMSALFITLFLRMKQPQSFSLLSAWFKGVGTILITIFCFLHFKDGFLLSMCIVTGILDIIYISMLHRNHSPEISAR